jgi:hypothetical protein
MRQVVSEAASIEKRLADDKKGLSAQSPAQGGVCA